jgi:hypothetical protein
VVIAEAVIVEVVTAEVVIATENREGININLLSKQNPGISGVFALLRNVLQKKRIKM